LLSFFLGIDEPAANIDHVVTFWDGPAGQPVRPVGLDPSAYLHPDSPAYRPAGVQFVPAVSLPTFFRDRSWDDVADQVEELRRLGGTGQFLGHPLALGEDPAAEAYVVTQGYPQLLYALHRQVADADRDLAAAAAAGDTDRADRLRRQRDALAWFHGSAAAHRREIARWQVLLEVGSHDRCGMCWWDAGHLQVLIDSRDLASGDFARTYARIQTS
jgi:hypothetical protein